jgi:hypothetical protein
MPKLSVPEGTSVARQSTAIPRVNVSVTPEQIAGPEVRLLTELGKKADEVTAFVVKQQNTKDLEIVTRADTAMKELLMEQRHDAEKRRGINASGILTEATNLFDSNMQPADGQNITEAHKRYLDVYESADPRQQSAMDMQRNKQRILHLKAMGSYEETQTSAAALAGHKANVEISVAKAIAGTEEEAQAEISDIIMQNNSIKALTGEEASTIEAEQMKDISAIHTGRLKNYINAKDITGAEDYFSKHKDEMIGDTSTMQKSIATSKEDIQAEKVADGATMLRRSGKWSEAVALLDKLLPSVQKKAYEQFNRDIKEEDTIRAHRAAKVTNLTSQSVHEKKQDGKWMFTKYSDLPVDLRQGIEETPGMKKTWLDEMSTRNDPIEPSEASQVPIINNLLKLQFGTREQQRQFAAMPLTGLDSKTKQAFYKDQQEILNPKPGGGQGKTQYLASAIKRSNFDATNEGDMEVQGQLVMEVIKSVAAGEGKTDTKAAGDLTFDEYRKVVDQFFNPGKVSTMKKANSRPQPDTDKGKTFGTPKDMAKNYMAMRGGEGAMKTDSDEGAEAAWIDSVSKYASQYYQQYRKNVPNKELDRFMQFAEKNVVQYEGGGMMFGDASRVLSQVPEIERNEKVYEIVDGEKYTYGEVNGVGLPANKQKRLAGQIKEYLQKAQLPTYFKNKAAAYHSIHRADAKAKAEAARVQRENKILSGKTKAGEDKRQLFDSAMRNSYSALQEFRDNKWEGMAPDTLTIIDLALEKKKRGARR